MVCFVKFEWRCIGTNETGRIWFPHIEVAVHSVPFRYMISGIPIVDLANLVWLFCKHIKTMLSNVQYLFLWVMVQMCLCIESANASCFRPAVWPFSAFSFYFGSISSVCQACVMFHESNQRLYKSKFRTNHLRYNMMITNNIRSSAIQGSPRFVSTLRVS